MDNGRKRADYNTSSITTFLASIGRPYGFNYRKNLAKRYGIDNYNGKAVHNLQLLDLLKESHRNNGKV